MYDTFFYHTCPQATNFAHDGCHNAVPSSLIGCHCGPPLVLPLPCHPQVSLVNPPLPHFFQLVRDHGSFVLSRVFVRSASFSFSCSNQAASLFFSWRSGQHSFSRSPNFAWQGMKERSDEYSRKWCRCEQARRKSNPLGVRTVKTMQGVFWEPIPRSARGDDGVEKA